MGPAKFRTKPSTVEAIRWDGSPETTKSILEWVKSTPGATPKYRRSPVNPNRTLTVTQRDVGGTLSLDTGDWLVKRESGFVRFTDDAFEAEFETAGRRRAARAEEPEPEPDGEQEPEAEPEPAAVDA